MSLLKHYSATTINKFVSCYNKCIKKRFFGMQGWTVQCMPGALIDLCLPSANTVLHNARTLFEWQYLMSCNRTVEWLVVTGI